MGRDYCIGLQDVMAWRGRLERAAGVGREIVLGYHQVMVWSIRLPQGLCSGSGLVT